MKNKIEDLRNHLFETIESLKDGDKPMELDRAKAIADVAQVVINSAKVEVDFMRAVNATKGTGFIPTDAQATTRLSEPRLIKGRAQSGSGDE